MMDVSPDELPLLYSWIDGIPLSRPKRNIARDFSDGVLVAEVVAHYCPKLVDVHNYSAANSLAQKVYNWNTLNVKVFRRLHFTLTKDDIEAVANCEPQMIERILKLLKYKAEFTRSLSPGKVHESSPESGVESGEAPRKRCTHTRARRNHRAPGSKSEEARTACQTERTQNPGFEWEVELKRWSMRRD